MTAMQERTSLGQNHRATVALVGLASAWAETKNAAVHSRGRHKVA